VIDEKLPICVKDICVCVWEREREREREREWESFVYCFSLRGGFVCMPVCIGERNVADANHDVV
jgi:hypothetical protein